METCKKCDIKFNGSNCPICGKKQYKTVSGFTINMIEGNKTFRVVCKDLN